MKKCSSCKIEKLLFQFNENSNRKDKVQYYCIYCHNSIQEFYRKTNSEQYNRYFWEKRANDETFRLANKLRIRLRQALLKQIASKTAKTDEILGISFDQMKIYIEFFMTADMSWENLDLDHVQRLSSFDFTDPKQLKEASNFSFIQPLLKSNKREKGSIFHELVFF